MKARIYLQHLLMKDCSCVKKPWQESKNVLVAFVKDRLFLCEEIFSMYNSDGTSVGLYLVHRHDVTTCLYGNGHWPRHAIAMCTIVWMFDYLGFWNDLFFEKAGLYLPSNYGMTCADSGLKIHAKWCTNCANFWLHFSCFNWLY